MDYCMKSRNWKAERIVGLVLMIFLLCAFVGISIGLLFADSNSTFVTVSAVVIFFLGIGVFLFMFHAYVQQGRKYCMDAKGITVSYFPKYKKFYPWETFSSAVVCDFGHATKNPENCYLIIRLAAFDEPDGPYSEEPSRTFWGMEKWRGNKYTERNFNNIIFLGFSPDLLEELQQLSKLPATYSFTEYGKKHYEQNKADGDWYK